MKKLFGVAGLVAVSLMATASPSAAATDEELIELAKSQTVVASMAIEPLRH